MNLLTKIKFECPVGEEALSLPCIGVLPTVPLWFRTLLKKLSLGHDFKCSRPLELPGGTNRLVLINLLCNLIAEFGGLWLCLTWQEPAQPTCPCQCFSNFSYGLPKHPAKSHMHEQRIKPHSPTWKMITPPLNHLYSVPLVKWLKVGDQEELRALQVRQ